MSNAVWTTLPGLKWDRQVIPMFSTNIERAQSGYEARSSNRDFPLWELVLSYEVLRDDKAVAVNVAPSSPLDELRKIEGFFLARKGAHDNFLYTVDRDAAVTDQLFGVGDGSTVEFQLIRTYGAGGFTFAEPVHNVNVLTDIKEDNVAQASPADYTIDAVGRVTMASAPTLGQLLTWTGTYYYRVRFERDLAEFAEFMKDLHELKTVRLVGSLGSKI